MLENICRFWSGWKHPRGPGEGWEHGVWRYMARETSSQVYYILMGGYYRESQKTWDMPISLLHYMRPCQLTRPRSKSSVKFKKHHTNFSRFWCNWMTLHYFKNVCQKSPSRLPILMFFGTPCMLIFAHFIMEHWPTTNTNAAEWTNYIRLAAGAD